MVSVTTAILVVALCYPFVLAIVYLVPERLQRLVQPREVGASALAERLGDFVSFSMPSGGTAIWVKTKRAKDLTRWAEAARANGVAFDSPAEYGVNPSRVSGVRLGFASLNEDELRQAVTRLARAREMNEGRHRHRGS